MECGCGGAQRGWMVLTGLFAKPAAVRVQHGRMQAEVLCFLHILVSNRDRRHITPLGRKDAAERTILLCAHKNAGSPGKAF